MEPNGHLNAFCVLFAKLKEVCSSGSGRKESQEAKDICKKMYSHYPMVTDAMVKYLDQFTAALISLGFNFDEMKVCNKVDVSDLDVAVEVKVTGKFEYAKLVDVNATGKIYNYNEHSIPLTSLSYEECEALKAKTINSMRKSQELMFSGKAPRSAQQMSWGLPDESRDW